MSTATVPAFHHAKPLHFPESDGKPMAETDKHRKQMIALLNALEEYYHAEAGIYVTGNILVHYRNEIGEWKFLAPDIIVVKGIAKKDRGSYVIEDEGKAPDFIIELVSPSSKVEDFGNKRVIYAGWGVKEYFLFDPTGELFSGPLRGYRLEDNEYVPMMGARLHSDVLNLDLVVERSRLRLYHPQTGKYLLTHEESEAGRRAAEAKAAQEAAARQAAEAKAAQEAAARQAAEAKVAAAEAELARLREELAKRRLEN